MGNHSKDVQGWKGATPPAAPRDDSFWSPLFAPFGGRLGKIFDDLFREMESMGWTPARAPFASMDPKVDVRETEKELLVSAELPGMDAKDVEVLLSGTQLTIKGERSVEKEEKKADFKRMERNYGCFQRTIELPAEVEQDPVEATFSKGVLNLTLKKTPGSTTRKINVKAK